MVVSKRMGRVGKSFGYFKVGDGLLKRFEGLLQEGGAKGMEKEKEREREVDRLLR